MTKMKSLTALALGAVAMGVLSAQAVAGTDSLEGAGLNLEQVTAIVTEAGYVFEEAEYEAEDGVIEAEGTKDGVEWELTLDAQTGEILEVEQDD